jgi:hypothetical protein
MSLLKVVLVWIKTNGFILAWIIYTGLFIWGLVVVYRVVDEVLSIAQRGYFISVPQVADKLRLKERLKRRIEGD